MSRRLRVVDSPGSIEPDLASQVQRPEELAVAAEQRGYERGASEAQAAADARLEALAERLAAIEQALGDELERIRCDCESQAVEAALHAGVEIARRILEQEVALDPSTVASSVRSALARLPDAGELEIRLHPEDLETVQRCRDLRDASHGGKIFWTADDSVDRGGCVVIADAGVVDARLRAQLARIRDSLFAGTAES